MKSHILLQGIIFILITSLIGCKKEEIPNSNSFFSNCKLDYFRLQGQLNDHYFAHYNTDNTLKGVSIDKNSDNNLYSYTFDNQRLTHVYIGNAESKYLAFKYEYSLNGIEVIRRYDPPQNEYGRIIFKYGDNGKPSSMAQYSVKKDVTTNTEILTPWLAYDYEYNERGNLVKQVYYTPDTSQNMRVLSTSYHSYDDQDNTLKQLYYIFYSVSASAPYIFSKNNKVATKTITLSQSEFDENLKIEYDSKGNVTKDGLLFSDIKWQCP